MTHPMHLQSIVPQSTASYETIELIQKFIHILGDLLNNFKRIIRIFIEKQITKYIPVEY
uniref:Uncharacterized protein n=1 Tax=Parascaris equorum TaxID=6256 RepID=A0A914R2E4_PAREQ